MKKNLKFPLHKSGLSKMTSVKWFSVYFSIVKMLIYETYSKTYSHMGIPYGGIFTPISLLSIT